MTAPRGRRWIARGAGFLVGGCIRGTLLWAIVAVLPDVRSPLVPLVAGTGLASAVVGLLLFRVVVGPPRVGPVWGGLIGAWIPAVLTGALALVALLTGDLSAGDVRDAAALLYLSASPVTVVLGLVGGALERRWPGRAGG